MAAPHFLVHNTAETTGVGGVEDGEAGNELTGWVMETDGTVTVKARDPIPLGHKISLGDIRKGDTIIKYGHDIGRAMADIPEGGHVHVDNVKTKRW